MDMSQHLQKMRLWGVSSNWESLIMKGRSAKAAALSLTVHGQHEVKRLQIISINMDMVCRMQIFSS